MQKICVVYSFKPSAWVSCQKIVANLLKAYKLNPDIEIIPVPYSVGMEDYQCWASTKIILDEKPSHVVILDHRPHCHHILEPLIRSLKEINHRPTFIFHLYGDFTLTLSIWRRLEPIIKEYQVLWYAASIRQRAMLAEYIPLEQMEICPFPVDSTEFYPSKDLRLSFREKKNWGEDETIFVFTGRLSRQKRIHQLIETFTKWRRETKATARLVLVGDADKVGEPFLLRGEYEGEYFHYLYNLWKNLPEADQQYIEFHGFRPNIELNAYYNASDFFVNISVHNDEDYGMSCAEALATGLPLILTDWAGFSSFRRRGIEDAVKLIPVKISRRGKLISLKSLYKAFDEMHARKETYDRSYISQQSLSYTGVKNVANIVRKGLTRSHIFEKFSDTLHEAARLEIYQKWNTFADLKSKTFNDLYMKVYRHYVE